MYLQPKLNWTSKDYYNAADLNRVENNTLEVKSIMEFLFGAITIDFVITNRDYSSIEFPDSLNRIEKNIDILGSYLKVNGWEINKTSWHAGDPFTFLDAIRLESNLDILYNISSKNAANVKYCGTFSCGEGGI